MRLPRLAMLGCVVATLAACASTASPVVTTDPAFDPAAPTVVKGHFLNAAGMPAIGAAVSLEVWDDANAQIGQPVPVVLELEAHVAIDGSFEFRFVPAARLKAFAAANDNYVNFQLTAHDSSTSGAGFWAFPRQIDGDGWVGDAPSVTLHENGPATQP